MIQFYHTPLNIVWRVGPWVFKCFAKEHGRRRFWSEVLTRDLLVNSGIPYLPLVTRSVVANTIVLPFIPQATLLEDRATWTINAFVDAVLQLSQTLDRNTKQQSFGWLDHPRRSKRYTTFSAFLSDELARNVAAHGDAFLDGRTKAVEALYRAIRSTSHAVLCPTDIAPKNTWLVNGDFLHFDFENSLLAPLEFFCCRTIANLLLDLRDVPSVLDHAAPLLACCSDDNATRAALAFVLHRMLLYNSRAHRGSRPTRALARLCAGESAVLVLREMQNELGDVP